MSIEEIYQNCRLIMKKMEQEILKNVSDDTKRAKVVNLVVSNYFLYSFKHTQKH